MSLAKVIKVGAPMMTPPGGRKISLNASDSAIARVGDIAAWFNPSVTAESASPLSVPDFGNRNWRFKSETEGESPLISAEALNGLGAYNFDGANDAVDLININGLSPVDVFPSAGTAYSVAAVVRFDTLTGNSVILGGVRGAANESRLQVSSAGSVSAWHGSSSVSTPVGAIVTNRTYLIAQAYDPVADTLAVFIDGTLKNSLTDPLMLDNLTLQIGNYAASGVAQTDALIGDVIVMKWALHAADDLQRAKAFNKAIMTKWGIS